MKNNFYSFSKKMLLMRHWVHLILQPISCYLAIFQSAISIRLAYEYKSTKNDTRLIAIIQSIRNFWHIYFPLFYVLRFLQRYFAESPYYPFIDEIVQTTTRVIFTRSQRSGQHICLKLWRRTENEVCDERLIIRNDEYLIEGLAFNKKFAPGVYLGIATVIVNDDNKHIQRGRLIEHPIKEQLILDERYALVMRTLKLEQRLDYQLINKKINIDFLACEVAQMHRHLEPASNSDIYGRADRIAAKFHLNNELFLEALNKFPSSRYKKYRQISTCLEEACNTYTSLFEGRYIEGHIKRCHGDLKVTNLWVQSFPIPYLQSYFPSKLLALDCIDFKPEFCFIDTLSDVAMLVIDLERLYPQELELAKRFLRSYLHEMHEIYESVEPLLEYYLTEKAMVCSYVSILFDNHQHTLGERYLQIASRHARRLQKLNKAAKQKREIASGNEPELSTTIASLSVEDAEHLQGKQLVYSN